MAPPIIRKVCILGDPAVGKTSLVRRISSNTFSDHYVTTVGAAVNRKTAVLRPPGHLGEVRVKFILWDVTGHRRHVDVLPYLKGADAGLVVSDALRVETQVNLWKWVESFRSAAGNVPVLLLVNKSDMADSTLDHRLMDELAVEYGCTYRLASARTGKNVERAFLELAQWTLQDRVQGRAWGGGWMAMRDSAFTL